MEKNKNGSKREATPKMIQIRMTVKERQLPTFRIGITEQSRITDFPFGFAQIGDTVYYLINFNFNFI